MLSYLIESSIFALKIISVFVPIVFVIILLVEKYKTSNNFLQIVLSFIEFLMIFLVVIPIVILIGLCEYLKDRFKESKKAINTKKEVHYGK